MALRLATALATVAASVAAARADAPVAAPAAWAAAAAAAPAPDGLTAPAADGVADAAAALPSRLDEGFLSNVFGSTMVFQVGAPIVLWGAVPTGTFVTVDMAPGDGHATGVGDADGYWRAQLPAVTVPGGTYTLTASTASGFRAVLTNVTVGWVLICSGQSNLSGATTPLSYLFNGTASAAAAGALPWVRLFTVGERATQGLLPPQRQLGYAPRLPWTIANASAAAGFSGVCWMAVKEIAAALGPSHPIGVIETAWSGTCIQAWLPADALATCGPVPPAQGWQTNSTLFNQLVAPFTNAAAAGDGGGALPGMAAAGLVWYQGESNAIYCQDGYYDCALAALLRSWRVAFNAPAMWAGVVQLAPWSGFGVTAEEAAGVRAAQLRVALADPLVTLATAVDLGDIDAPQGSIHPRPKQALGARLAAGAVAHFTRGSGGSGGGSGGGGGAAPDASTRGPVAAGARAGGGAPGALSATVTFAPPFDAPGSLALVNASVWPGLAPTGACPAAPDAVCAGFQLRDGATGAWHDASAELNADASAVVLSAAPGAGSPGAAANETASGYTVWPAVTLFAAAGSGGLPAYPWKLPVE